MLTEEFIIEEDGSIIPLWYKEMIDEVILPHDTDHNNQSP